MKQSSRRCAATLVSTRTALLLGAFLVQKHYAAAALGRLAGNADNRVAIAKAKGEAGI